MNAIAGPDPQDSTCLNEAVPDYTADLGRELRGIRLGLPKEYMIEGIDPQVRAAVEKAVAHFDSLGAEIIDVSLPHTEYAIASYYMIASAEASANLARFDGVRYGHRAENPLNLFDHYSRTREEGFGPEVKRRIILGTYVLSSGYYEAYYARAQKVRTLIRRDFAEAFARVDALISPTSPVAGISARREKLRSVADVSGRYFHERGEPGRHLRDQSAVRICPDGEWNGTADWIAVAGQGAG